MSATECKAIEEDFDAKKSYERHAQSDPAGGLFIRDEENVTGVVFDVVRQMGRKVMEGSMIDVMAISRPAIISHYITYLEAIALDFFYSTPLLTAAAKASDPLTRMKYCVAFAMAGLHQVSTLCQAKGPLNPILGETFQAERPDGSHVYCEQISHHPPISLYSIYGPGGLYQANGWGEVKVHMGMNSIEGVRMGKTTVNFKDGSQVQISNPTLKATGLVMGKKVMNYCKNMVFVDKKNSLMGEIYFQYEESEKLKHHTKNLGKDWCANIEKRPSDFFACIIYKYQKMDSGEIKKEAISSGCGSWLEYVQFDGKVIWRIGDKAPDWSTELSDGTTILPSHSQHRQDAINIKAKNYADAQIEKEKLENLQRHDKKLRLEMYGDKK